MSRADNVKWGPLAPVIAKLVQGKPRDVDGINNITTLEYVNRLTRYVLSPIHIKNWPETWDWNYIMRSLMLYGKVQITDTEAGVLPLPCTLYGINVFQQPTNCLSANPILGTVDRMMGKDCVLWRITYNYEGLYNLIEKYAYKLAGLDATIDINIINCRTPFFGQADSDGEAKTIKRTMGKYYEGEPIIVTGSGIPGKIIPHDAHNTFITDKLQLAKQSIVNEFLTDIGINNVNINKKERLIVGEAESNDIQVQYSMWDCLCNLYYCIARSNEMYADFFGDKPLTLQWMGKEVIPSEPLEFSRMESGNMGLDGNASSNDPSNSGD